MRTLLHLVGVRSLSAERFADIMKARGREVFFFSAGPVVLVWEGKRP